MNRMRIYNQMGRLSKEGSDATKEFRDMVKLILSDGKTKAETRLIGSLLQEMVGNLVSDQVVISENY